MSTGPRPEPGPARTPSGDALRSARVAGLAATATALVTLWACAAVTGLVPFPPTSVAGRIVRLTPGPVSTFFIEALGHWALRLLTGGVLVAALAVGTEALVRLSPHGRPRPAAAAAVLSLLAAAAALADPSQQPDPIYLLAAVIAAGVLYTGVARAVYRRLRVEDQEPDGSRRSFVRLAFTSVGVAAVGGGVIAWAWRRLAGPDTDVAVVEPAVRATVPPAGDFPRVTGLSPEITSVADHYRVDINIVQPAVEAEGWTVSVGGLVDEPLKFDFAGLQERYEVVERFSTLTCVSNEVGGDLVGHSAWGGPLLRDVLEQARPDKDAVDVVFRAADGYSDSIPLALALDPQVILAVTQNGRPLTREHGFPCRVRVPRIFGMKNVKWLQSIEVVGSDYQGYWQHRGWSDDATVRTESRIDVAGRDGAATSGEQTWVAGIAWAGDRGISKVEVSVDGGESWAEAELKRPVAESSWRLWAWPWTPASAGTAVVTCRATDGNGSTQVSSPAPPHPSGATGLHRVAVEVA
jgi:DMSO/TMAO reductase YedYZ molybdopterin-dependent catalytic subunit